MEDSSALFAPFQLLMVREKLPNLAIRLFSHYYHLLLRGNSGLIFESDISPVNELPDSNLLPQRTVMRGHEEVHKTVVIKLNGGLGTSMGLESAKSLLLIKNEYTFLDIMALQSQHNKAPLVLMNSYNTFPDSRLLLRGYSRSDEKLPWDFIQHKIPKVDCSDMSPVFWPPDPQLEWCPPGHGDIYPSLITSGMLNTLLRSGYQYAFLSNGDNLGATIDEGILGYFVENNLPFLMEVAYRTQADGKGGQLVCNPRGGYLLRESSQCAKEDQWAFQDTQRHRYFNTNNLWINLVSLRQKLLATRGFLGLPLIKNQKTVDPRDPVSKPVFQLETAMGAAIACFDRASAIIVQRERFSPVKTTNDLLLVRSDAYLLLDDYRVVLHPKRNHRPPVVSLDNNFYRTDEQLSTYFPYGAPSLLECESFTIIGPVLFGANIRIIGKVLITNSSSQVVEIADSSVLEGEYLL